jgi:hypothetical protein
MSTSTSNVFIVSVYKLLLFVSGRYMAQAFKSIPYYPIAQKVAGIGLPNQVQRHLLPNRFSFDVFWPILVEVQTSAVVRLGREAASNQVSRPSMDPAQWG